MIRKILLAIVLIFLITGIGFASQDEIAFKNEPDGFRGLKWGDAPTEDMMLNCQHIYSGSTYYKKEDKLNIGNAELGLIYYMFNLYSNQFYKVLSTFYGENNYNTLKIIFEGRFGESTKTYKEYGFNVLQWTGEKTKIKLCYNSKHSEGYIVIESMKIHSERPEDNKQKEIEKAKEDF